ncbi:MAG: TonB-dependent receptor [Burkholderiaceae bacterium]|nr:TonB-dependent receptor [Burkholderiaceae bacterium]
MPVSKHKALVLAMTAAFSAYVPSVLAQSLEAPSDQSQKVETVEITGSSIKRINAETALPVQIIRREDIDRSGVTTAAELLSKVSASAAALTDGSSFTDLPGQRGFNGANLRGIGVSSTLVLLNGRRIANFASPGDNSGVDLNSIPAAAISRVEILKDGASAIYGSDAIGGVINFITRNDYQGGDVTVYTYDTQHGGAGKDSATLSGGIGNIQTDRFNLMGVLDFQKTQALSATQRSWVGSAYEPDINLDVSSSNTFPANFRRTNASGAPTGPRMNPSVPGCNPPSTVYAPDSFVGSTACLFDYMHDTQIFPDSKRLSLISRGQFALDGNTTLYAEVLENQTDTTYRISPATLTNLNYPVGGPYYPTSLITTNQTPLRVSMRLSDVGPRTNEIDANTGRLLLGAKGTMGSWDFDTAFNHSVSTVDDKYIDGYVNTSLFNAAFLSGQINPFGPSGSAGQSLLDAAKVSDDARHSVGTTDSIDFKASRELFSMAGGNAAIAFGLESRREKMEFTPSALLESGQLRGDPATPPFEGGRTVNAAYAELNLPLLKNLETQLAVRDDHYSDFGNTTNPKVGMRWSPAQELVVRGSYGTGFRAPSLSDLYSPASLVTTNGVYNDPLGCIKVGTLDNTQNPDYCGLQPDKLVGGSANLKPETSKQFSFGVVVEPSRKLTASLDYWRIEKSNVIESPEGSYFSDPAGNAAYITRGPADPALPGIPGPILQIDSRLRNLGTLETSGLDLNVNWEAPANSVGKFSVALNGTYVLDYKTQEEQGGPEVSGVGAYVVDQVIQRWRHTLTFNFDRGPWSATLQNTFYSGYVDQNPMPDGSIRRVDPYSLWDFATSYKVSKALSLRAGLKNVFDTNPPRSNQIFSFIAGYDPTYTDPRGRAIYASANYSFK